MLRRCGNIGQKLAGRLDTSFDALERVCGRRGDKGLAAAERLVEHAGKGEQVGALVHYRSVELFGRHVSDGSAARSAPTRGAREARHAKIGQFDVAAVVDEHVCRLDIEVQHAVFVRVSKRLT